MITIDEILAALEKVTDPELGTDIVTLHMIRDIEIQNQTVRLTFVLTTLKCPYSEQLIQQVGETVQSLPEVEDVEVRVTEMTSEEIKNLTQRLKSGELKPNPIPIFLDEEDGKSPAQQLSNIKHLIGVTSGKGGVGKSMITALLAVLLHRHSYQVGIFDADITGASIPQLFGLNGLRLHSMREGVMPIQTGNGVKIVSSTFMLKNPDAPVAWRGSKISQLIKDLWRDVIWGNLDFLLFDFPPGTSDTQLTISMDLPIEGLIVVTTPQELSSLIVRKAVNMSHEMKVPLLGVVENMSYFVCPDSRTRYEVFGPSHAKEVAEHAGAPLLAQIPIEPSLAKYCDDGKIEQYQEKFTESLYSNFIKTIQSQ
jgi:Mrp family chromosome partitioning ATPase